MPTLRAIAVYCGSSPGDDPRYAQAAHELGAALAARHINLVYGGGHVGLMGVIAQAAFDGGAHVTDHAVLLAGATISLLPIAIAFFLAQKYFVAGVATTGIK